MCIICRGAINGCPDCDPEWDYERKPDNHELAVVLIILGVWVVGMTFAVIASISPF